MQNHSNQWSKTAHSELMKLLTDVNIPAVLFHGMLVCGSEFNQMGDYVALWYHKEQRAIILAPDMTDADTILTFLRSIKVPYIRDRLPKCVQAVIDCTPLPMIFELIGLLLVYGSDNQSCDIALCLHAPVDLNTISFCAIA